MSNLSPSSAPGLPTISYPDSLPVCARRQDIMDAVHKHQVVVIAGETGSGKTTQIPKMLLEMGLAERGSIGHTQPRRLAARSVAERIAEELGEPLGQTVGYQVRFTTQTSETTRIKLMTDGILLAEIPHDRLLKRYSAIIIDEAHERSLNIDFILGYLKRILPQRPDLKVIITSATIDPQRFARHFAPSFDPVAEHSEDEQMPADAAPIIEVSGRTYPVQIRYRPLSTAEQTEQAEDENADDLSRQDQDPLDAICKAVLELREEGPGDILIFFAGEREIRNAADALEELVRQHSRLAGTEVLPLFARLSMAEQHRVFRPSGKPRIVLATNVAETSLTVPGIRYVIDPGTARISRYSARTKVQRLPIERISQASAAQRSGRCGRTSEGIAIRLYSEEDFLSRPEFTDPEILRTNLAAVILQTMSIGVVRSPKDVERFPFVQPPARRAITDGVTVLRELGALRERSDSRSSPLTGIGRKIAAFPVDPRLARMIVASQQLGVAKEVMVLAAALTIQDPRERPTEKRTEADEHHARFADEKSDFSGYLLLWHHLQEQQKALSSSQFRKMCQREFISYLRVREWQDLYEQLRQMGSQAGVRVSRGREIQPGQREELIHRALLTGLLSHIGHRLERNHEYQGARGTRFSIFPGSALFAKKPDWIMAAELVETSKLWARVNAAVEPEWIEQAAGSLLQRTYAEPHWSAGRGAVMARERATLFGVPIFADRLVDYWRIDPQLSRELFIRKALVEGDWRTRHRFFHRNRKRLAEIEALEARLRRRDLRVEDEAIFAFYDQRIPADVVSERHFDRWWKKARAENEHLLDFDPEQLLETGRADYDESAYPRTWVLGEGQDALRLDLTYEFAPSAPGTAGGDSADGVFVQVPIVFLNQLCSTPFEWMIPGLRTELITALIRSMPKAVRKSFVPAPDVAAQAAARLEEEFDPARDPLLPSLERTLRRLKGVVIPPNSWDWEKVPEHLRVTFQVRDPRNRLLGEGKDLAELQERLRPQIRQALAASLGASADALTRIASAAQQGTDDAAQAGSPSGTPTQRVGEKTRRNPESRGEAGKPAPSGAASGSSAGAQVIEVSGLTDWPHTQLPAKITRRIQGAPVQGFPALVDEGKTVAVRVMASEAEQTRAQRSGVIRLLACKVPSPQKYVSEHLRHDEKIVFTQNPHGSVESLIADCTVAALDKLTPDPAPRTAEEFDALFQSVRAELIDTVFEVTSLVAKILKTATQVRRQLKSKASLSTVTACNDIKAQLEHLVYPGFVSETGAGHLVHLPRYLQGMLIRLEKLDERVSRDSQMMLEVQDLEDEFDAAAEQHTAEGTVPADLAEVGWMLEELRVSYFAQQLGTAQTVSTQRIRKALKAAVRRAQESRRG